jgi:DNA-binding SARP family transcriptional activator
MANAQYALAEGFIRDLPAERRPAGPHLVLSRVDLQQGDYEAAARASQAVLDVSASDPVQRDHALLNLLTVSFNFGDGEQALALAVRLRDTTSNDNLRSIAEASIGIMDASTERDLEIVNRRLLAMARAQRRGQAHHFGVSMYNLAANSLVSDRLVEAERQVDEALLAFVGTSSAVERQAAAALRIGILLRTGRQLDALSSLGTLMSADEPLQNDVLLEIADTFDAFGDSGTAEGLLDRVGDSSAHTLVDRRAAALTWARVHLRRGEPDLARLAIRQYPDGIATVVGMSVWHQVLDAQIALAQGDPAGPSLLSSALAKASEAGIHSARRVAELLLATVSGAEALGRTINVVGDAHPWHLTALADVLIPQISELGDNARAVIGKAAALHPARWRSELRQAIGSPLADPLHAAKLLEQIGERRDIRLLRDFAKNHRKDRRAAEVGKELARRLALPVFVEDQGRVVIRTGEREIEGATVRRKVLALLCFLLSKPGMSAARDQVLDVLWPDLDPDVAANSLNQTLYFLRRVLEQDYEEDLSPGYVHYENDVIWLDSDLVSSRTSDCRRFMRSLSSRPTPDDVSKLADLYNGRFALDFEYEGWASEYRDSIHAEYLEIVERSLIDDVSTGHHDRAIKIARRALDVDPRSDRVEESLLRLYKAAGAHSAAAEQYSHYSGVLRDELGIESPPLESL